MNKKDTLENIGNYYSSKLKQHGPSPKGVDWNGDEAQQVRFRNLLSIGDLSQTISVNDYGCGYGALVQYMIDEQIDFHYTGFDISPTMIASARQSYAHLPHCRFVEQDSALMPADYTVASGVFNMKLDAHDEEWKAYILETLGTFAAVSTRGFSFNCLTKYSDAEYMRPTLYYADPLFLFDHCKRTYSRYVSLIHDYPLYDFTIQVKLESS